MQNKSNTTDMQVKHFVKTIPDTLGFQADFTSALNVAGKNEFEILVVQTDDLQHALEVSKYIYTWKKEKIHIRQSKGSFTVLFVILKRLLNCF